MCHCGLRHVHVGSIRRQQYQIHAQSGFDEGTPPLVVDKIVCGSADPLQLNTSQVGQGLNLLGDSKPGESSGGGLGGLLDKAKDAAQDVGNNAIDAAAGAVTDALDIKDFYSAHLMTFCEGDFKPDASDPNADEEVTACSARKAFYNFDPTAIIESKLPKGLSLSDIKWPDEVTNGVNAIKAASRAMFFFYLIGIAAAGIAMIGAVFGVLAYEHKVAMANLAINAVSPLALFNEQPLTN
jgi:SUR7/PalI family